MCSGLYEEPKRNLKVTPVRAQGKKHVIIDVFEGWREKRKRDVTVTHFRKHGQKPMIIDVLLVAMKSQSDLKATPVRQGKQLMSIDVFRVA